MPFSLSSALVRPPGFLAGERHPTAAPSACPVPPPTWRVPRDHRTVRTRTGGPQSRSVSANPAARGGGGWNGAFSTTQRACCRRRGEQTSGARTRAAAKGAEGDSTPRQRSLSSLSTRLRLLRYSPHDSSRCPPFAPDTVAEGVVTRPPPHPASRPSRGVGPHRGSSRTRAVSTDALPPPSVGASVAEKTAYQPFNGSGHSHMPTESAPADDSGASGVREMGGGGGGEEPCRARSARYPPGAGRRGGKKAGREWVRHMAGERRGRGEGLGGGGMAGEGVIVEEAVVACNRRQPRPGRLFGVSCALPRPVRLEWRWCRPLRRGRGEEQRWVGGGGGKWQCDWGCRRGDPPSHPRP